MRGKNILVTGASQGIGRGVAEFLLKEGAKVVLVARQQEKLQELVAKYKSQAFAFSFDLNELEKIEDIFSFCREKEIKLHGMFHAAATAEECPIRVMEPEDIKNYYRLNFFSYVILCKFFSMKKYSYNGASIVTMSSLASLRCDKGMAQYVSAKSSVNAFTKVMSKELIKRKIRVNAIAPAFVDTDMAWKTRDARYDFDEYLQSEQPYGVIPVKQIAYLAEFLLSDKSAYITGDVIPVSGGMRGE